MISNLKIPTFTEEKELQVKGYHYVAGIDEVGRGALAGPVLAAAVILPRYLETSWLNLVRDSKQLSPQRRQFLSYHIRKRAVATGVGVVDGDVIDAQGIVKATQLAMKLAIEELSPPAEALLIDYMTLADIELPQKGITDGDSLCFSIACASIVAKVARDELMTKLDGVYPGYGLAQHKGYGTPEHLNNLCKLGPCPIHRRSFRPIRNVLAE